MSDPAGLRTAPDGTLLMATQWPQVWRLDPESGAITSFTGGGLTFTNGLVAAPDGSFWVSDFVRRGRVVHFSATGEVLATVDPLRNPNGLALSPDGRTLYVAAGSSWADGEILAMSADGSGRPSTVWTGRGVDSLAVDRCGLLYFVEYTGQALVRLDPSDGSFVRIGRVRGHAHSALRFSPGSPAWPRSWLFVGDRGDQTVQVFDVGRDGLHVLQLAERP